MVGLFSENPFISGNLITDIKVHVQLYALFPFIWSWSNFDVHFDLVLFHKHTKLCICEIGVIFPCQYEKTIGIHVMWELLHAYKGLAVVWITGISAAVLSHHTINFVFLCDFFYVFRPLVWSHHIITHYFALHIIHSCTSIIHWGFLSEIKLFGDKKGYSNWVFHNYKNGNMESNILSNQLWHVEIDNRWMSKQIVGPKHFYKLIWFQFQNISHTNTYIPVYCLQMI